MNPEIPKLPLKVLVLEDCEEDLFFLVRKLRKGGYQPEVERVWTKEATREALRRRAWDIIISDGLLPGFDGLQALAMVKEMGLATPFILLSGLIPAKTAAAAKTAGAFDCIAKNDLDLLLPAIERALVVAKQGQPGLGKGPSPPSGRLVIAQCQGFRCLAYLDSDGKWREHRNSKELPDVLDWFEA
jgi:DNA-binding NtrC family response regulator